MTDEDRPAVVAPLAWGYPDGYRDPAWDGTEAQFRDIVLPARLSAITESLDGVLAAKGLTVRFRWAGQ